MFVYEVSLLAFILKRLSKIDNYISKKKSLLCPMKWAVVLGFQHIYRRRHC